MRGVEGHEGAHASYDALVLQPIFHIVCHRLASVVGRVVDCVSLDLVSVNALLVINRGGEAPNPREVDEGSPGAVRATSQCSQATTSRVSASSLHM